MSRWWWGIIGGLLVTGLAGGSAPVGARSADEPLDWAFRFASAVASDPKDRSRAQEAVVREQIAQGDLEGAIAFAERIEGWRRGVVQADLAAELARAGRTERARDLLRRAETARAGAASWEGPRIDAHLAQAHAALGDDAAARELAAAIESGDDRQYAGRAAATLAETAATRGDFDRAMRKLDVVENDDDYEVAWWRASGYLSLARTASFTLGQRIAAAQAAQEAALRIPGWKRIEALLEVAAVFQGLAKSEQAAEALTAAAGLIAPDAVSADVPPLLANLARAWARIGRPEPARAALARAEALVPGCLVIDQPGLYANLALGHAAIADAAGSARLYDRAFGAAEALENARPRALAAVDLCVALSRDGRPLTAPTRERLARLLGDLRAPW